jgi:hypothetical protein
MRVISGVTHQKLGRIVNCQVINSTLHWAKEMVIKVRDMDCLVDHQVKHLAGIRAIISNCPTKVLSIRRKNVGIFQLSLRLIFSANFYVGCLEAEMRQKNFGPKKLRIFFHETTKTPREVFDSHHGESLS